MKSVRPLLLLLCAQLFVSNSATNARALSSSEPFEVKTLKLRSGVELEFVERGISKSKTIIFLHGYSDSWHSFEKILTLMPDSFYCIAISQRGHGNSSKPPKGYHPKDFAKDLADFIKAKQLVDCIIAGHSMGGVIAQQFAVDYPDLLKGLIILSSDACFNDNPGLNEFKAEVMNLKKVDHAFAEGFQKSTIVKPIDSLALQLFISESLKLPIHVWHQTLEGILSVDYTTALRSINVPVLILWGTNDQMCFESDQEKFIQNLKNGKLLKYAGAGHALHWEEPEQFVSDVTNFALKVL